MRLMVIICAAILFVFSTDLYGEVSSGENKDSKTTSTTNVIPKEFQGITLGVGLAITFSSGGRDRIYEATVDGNGIVRVSKEANREPKVMLESHYFFEPDGLRYYCDKCGWGPFIAIQPGSSDGNTIGAYAIGLMFGAKRSGQSSSENSSFNIGIGYIVNTGVKTLGDGLTENEKIDEKDTIRYKYVNQPGGMIIVSFAF